MSSAEQMHMYVINFLTAILPQLKTNLKPLLAIPKSLAILFAASNISPSRAACSLPLISVTFGISIFGIIKM